MVKCLTHPVKKHYSSRQVTRRLSLLERCLLKENRTPKKKEKKKQTNKMDSLLSGRGEAAVKLMEATPSSSYMPVLTVCLSRLDSQTCTGTA